MFAAELAYRPFSPGTCGYSRPPDLIIFDSIRCFQCGPPSWLRGPIYCDRSRREREVHEPLTLLALIWDKEHSENHSAYYERERHRPRRSRRRRDHPRCSPISSVAGSLEDTTHWSGCGPYGSWTSYPSRGFERIYGSVSSSEWMRRSLETFL